MLRPSQRPVHAVSLTGHGRRRLESGPHVTLGDHVNDVVTVFEEHDLTDATLVGHSYGGRVITRAWPELAARVHRMIYLDAHAPLQIAEWTNTSSKPAVDHGGMIPFGEFIPADDVFGGASGTAAFYERLMPQSAMTLAEPFSVDLPSELDKTFVFAASEPSPQFRPYADAAKADPSWRYVELPATHWLMYTHPADVAAIILDPQSIGGR